MRARLCALGAASLLAWGCVSEVNYPLDPSRTATPTPTATPDDTPEPNGVHTRSIGTDTAVLFSAGTVTVSQGVNLTFTDPLTDRVGEGDRIILSVGGDGAEAAYLGGRASTTAFLQRPAENEHVDVAFVIERAYNSLQVWEETRGGELEAENRNEIGLAYNDGPFSEHLEFAGNAGGPQHVMTLSVAVGERHTGREGTGVVMDSAGNDYYVQINDDYVEISWFELKGWQSDSSTGYVRMNGVGIIISNLIVHDFFDADDSLFGVGQGGSRSKSGIVFNTIVYDGDTRGGITGDESSDLLKVVNCTVYNMAGEGIDEDNGQLEVFNTISMNNAGPDFAVPNALVANNMSSDGTAAGNGSIVNGNTTWFVQPGIDFHLSDVGTLPSPIDTGAAVSGMPAADIDGDGRPFGPEWDIGADEWWP